MGVSGLLRKIGTIISPKTEQSISPDLKEYSHLAQMVEDYESAVSNMSKKGEHERMGIYLRSAFINAKISVFDIMTGRKPHYRMLCSYLEEKLDELKEKALSQV